MKSNPQISHELTKLLQPGHRRDSQPASAAAFRSEDELGFFFLKNQVIQIYSSELKAITSLTNEHKLDVNM